jgi:glucose-6-phosphate isomerase, archaeal
MEEELKNPDIRKIKDLESVLYDKKWSKETENFDAYYMYRGVKKEKELRYDITIIPFKMFGEEFPKTKGHYHPERYGEIYKVLEGKAFYLLQKKDLSDIFVIDTDEGEFAVIPPGYGHITINPGKKNLKMANWVNPCFESEYEEIEEKNGGSYFYTINGWIKNINYKNIPDIRIEKGKKEPPKILSS